MPQISIRATRNLSFYDRMGLPPPPAELITRTSPPGREPNRRRHDSKIPGAIRRLYRLAHLTINTPSELLEFLEAYHNNPNDPIAFATALAYNEWIDRIFGYRAQLLKKHIYSHASYRLPVGFDTISRIWR